MIVSKHIDVFINYRNLEHFVALGYDGLRHGVIINIPVGQLMPGSGARLDCRCDDCKNDYQATARNALHQEVNRCVSCNRKHIHKTACADKLYTEETLNKRRDPQASEFRKYRVAVTRETRKTWVEHQEVINPMGYPRTLSGVEGGYQLDHRVPVSWAFRWRINPKVIGGVDNLQMLPWKTNIQKDVGFRNRRKQQEMRK